jgi:AhpD family alkylhydroperoxidase
MSSQDIGYPGLRLAPVDRPRGVLQRLGWWYARRRMGKVMMPLRVLYPRLPGLLRAQLGLYRLAESGLTLNPALNHLLALRISQNNGCTFCADLHHAMALHEGHPEALMAALDDYEASPHIDGPTRAALRYVDEMARVGNVCDATFDGLRACFNERQVVEIVWLNAFTTYLNLMAKPLGMGSDGFCDLARAKRRACLPP